MRESVRWHTGIGYAIIFVLIFNPSRLAQAGWTGAMNGTGYGSASVNVTSSTLVAGKASTVTMFYPSAAMAPTSGYSANALLPSGSSPYTVARIKGSAGYVWQANTVGYNGDKTDNSDIDARVTIPPANCTLLSMDSAADFSADGLSGSITVNATATAGTGLLLRGYEYPGGVPPTNLDLLTNGILKFDILLIGPFDLQKSNCTALIIPFTTVTGSSNIIFVSEAEAKSSALSIVCPDNIVFGCSDAVVYPPPKILSGGCQGVTVSYNPPANALVPGVMTNVTVTVSDGSTTTNCTFTALRQAVAFSGFFSPIGGTGGSCSSPLVSINQGSKIPVKFQDFCNGSPLSAGTPTLSIQACPPGTFSGGGNFQVTSNVWHFNWDTTGVPKGVYKLVATLQDGSQQTVFIQLN